MTTRTTYIKKGRLMKAVILAGGLEQELEETNKLPKSTISVCKKLFFII